MQSRGKAQIVMLALFVCFAPAMSQAQEDLPDAQYYGYKIVHHLGAVIGHMDEFGFNEFDHPRIADYRSFVITPALDHLYSKAVVDVRWGPVIIETPAKDDRYSSLEIFDMEHHAIYDKVLDKEGERFVLVHEDYSGKLPKGTVIRTASNFPFVFLRTQSFAFNDDKLANAYANRLEGVRIYPDRKYEYLFIGGRHDFKSGDALWIDARTLFHYEAIVVTPAMAAKMVGVGSQYLVRARDGRYFFASMGRSSPSLTRLGSRTIS